MLKVAGDNSLYQIDQEIYGRNKANKKDEMQFLTPQNITNIDLQALASYSVYAYHSVYVKNDGSAYALGDNRNGQISKFQKKEIFTKPTDIQFYKVEGETVYIKSAICCTKFTIYLAQVGNNQNNIKLLFLNSKSQKNQIILNTKSKVPICLYGGYRTSAAIDSDGDILVITESMLEKEIYDPIIEVLPNNEKATYVACCDTYILVLSQTGKIFKSNISYSNTLSTFKELNELRGKRFTHISGTYQHSLAVTDDGQVYGQGSNYLGKLGFNLNVSSVNNFTLLQNLKDYKIVDVYAGVETSLFLTENGTVLGCGSSRKGELFMATGNSFPQITNPTESILKTGVTFCVAGCELSAAFVDCQPPINSPNMICNFGKSDIKSTQPNEAISMHKIKNLEAQIAQKSKMITELENQIDSLHQNEQKKDQIISDLKKKIESAVSFDPYEGEVFSSSNMVDENYFIDEEDESYHKVICKVGEGATSITYKVLDEKNAKTMCKKVLKVEKGKVDFKNAQDALKEFEILYKIRHPCICHAIGINTAEKIDENNDETTTIAIFLEFLNNSLKESLNKKIMDNTLKTKVVIEIVHAMKFIHNLGMIHRDIKIDNIMLNSVFDAKIVDFGLVKIDECMFGVEKVQSSMTKGVGTLAYMSPEMLNEENYSNKTDVYSFGVVLYYIFIGNLPSYTMKDKMLGKPVPLPEPSLTISKFCLNLISKCLENNPDDRPSFDEILNDIKNSNYDLAPDIDKSIISKRDRELDFFETKFK